MPELPPGTERTAHEELVSAVGGDRDRWGRVADELTRRTEVMGPGQAAESVLADVRAGRL